MKRALLSLNPGCSIRSRSCSCGCRKRRDNTKVLDLEQCNEMIIAVPVYTIMKNKRQAWPVHLSLQTLPTHPLAKVTVFFPWFGNNPNHCRAKSFPGDKEIKSRSTLCGIKFLNRNRAVTSADSKIARSHLVQAVTLIPSFHGAVTYPHGRVTYSGSRSIWCKSTSLFFPFELEPYPLMAAPCTEVLLCVWEGLISEEKIEGSSLTMGWANL